MEVEELFKIGEIVFCPMRGIGVVEAVEERTMLNETKEYVIFQMKEPSIIMMIPKDKLERSGFRKLNSEKEADQVDQILSHEKIDISYAIENKIRTKKNQEKLSSGSFVQCSEVVRDLSCMDRVKTLNSMEKNMLSQAKRFLLGEYALIKQLTEKEAESQIEAFLTSRALAE